MKREEEDNAFLSSLGVTSADPEDIERVVLQQVLICNLCVHKMCLISDNECALSWNFTTGFDL